MLTFCFAHFSPNVFFNEPIKVVIAVAYLLTSYFKMSSLAIFLKELENIMTAEKNFPHLFQRHVTMAVQFNNLALCAKPDYKQER